MHSPLICDPLETPATKPRRSAVKLLMSQVLGGTWLLDQFWKEFLEFGID
ncbi:hypothetical protein [Cohnella sp.]|jgi:hypothetical protein